MYTYLTGKIKEYENKLIYIWGEMQTVPGHTYCLMISSNVSCTSDPFFEQSCKIYKVWKQAIKKAPDFDSKSGHIEKHCGMRSNHYFTRLWLFFILSRVMFFEICWDTEWQLQVTVDARKTHNAKSSMSFYLFVCFFINFFRFPLLIYHCISWVLSKKSSLTEK